MVPFPQIFSVNVTVAANSAMSGHKQSFRKLRSRSAVDPHAWTYQVDDKNLQEAKHNLMVLEEKMQNKLPTVEETSV